MLSLSHLSWDSRTFDVGAFGEVGVSISLAIGFTLLAKSVTVGFCLVELQDFSALNPSLSSSASLEDKPYHQTANRDSYQSFHFSVKNTSRTHPHQQRWHAWLHPNIRPKRKVLSYLHSKTNILLTLKNKWLSNMSNLAPKYFASAFANISWYISDPAKQQNLAIKETIT